MKSGIVFACILAFFSANLAGAAPPSGGQSVQGEQSVQGNLPAQGGSQFQGGSQPQEAKPLEPPVQGVGPPQKLEDYQQLTKKKKQYPGVSHSSHKPKDDHQSADTKEMTATSLLPPKPTKLSPFPGVWLRRQYVGERALNQEVRVASEVVLDQEARVCKMFD
ncbi:hypothetical protein BDV27DRAFT_153145 [Aspergillus caelatus]|uniref:Uncharacterized protein n=1 Tax=Aspergillus caelatus TaxID=61420 RepID=A0A5N7AHN4_9EURO|nr:uncharacterized protein BDV27DRAFT_153145 [Aspergillus caelatus]KAE8369265.1 hypothetical protein BDV27DRAFT_153145 [Aspergillus caelatus]